MTLGDIGHIFSPDRSTLFVACSFKAAPFFAISAKGEIQSRSSVSVCQSNIYFPHSVWDDNSKSAKLKTTDLRNVSLNIWLTGIIAPEEGPRLRGREPSDVVDRRAREAEQ